MIKHKQSSLIGRVYIFYFDFWLHFDFDLTFGVYATYQMVSSETKAMMQVTTSLLETKQNSFAL